MSNESNGPEPTTISTTTTKPKPKPTPIPSVVDHTKKGSSNSVSSNNKTASKTTSKDSETISIPKAEYDSLNSRINNLTQSLRQTKLRLYNIQDALALIQSTVVNTKNSM